VKFIGRLETANDEKPGLPTGIPAWLACCALAALLAVPRAVAQQAFPAVGAFASSANNLLPNLPEPQQAGSRTTDSPAPAPATASIHGVVVNGDGAVYEGARVTLSEVAGAASVAPVRQAATDPNGRFDFDDLPPGAFKLSVGAKGFSSQSINVLLQPGQSYETRQLVLSMSGTSAEIDVTASPTEIAQAQLKVEETQRVFGVIPNFYVTYVPNAAPLTTKQKFHLAWRTSIDPITFLSTGVVAGIEQANNSFSGYGQGAQGYAKRFGAGYADGFIGDMIGGAILPSWWKQDPRYHYKGTGSKRSRVLYAIDRAVLCSGDNGKTEVDYSGVLGGLAAAGISNLYYPAANRDGAALTFENAAYGTLGAAAGNLFQEFLVRKLTPRVPDYRTPKQ
jgi:hypothetical protein